MKKLSIVGIVVVIISIMMCCVSHAQTDTEITFRGVPWGQTLNETVADSTWDETVTDSTQDSGTFEIFSTAWRFGIVQDSTYLELCGRTGYTEDMPESVRSSNTDSTYN